MLFLSNKKNLETKKDFLKKLRKSHNVNIYYFKRASNSAFNSSLPGFPSNANMFFLYSDLITKAIREH